MKFSDYRKLLTEEKSKEASEVLQLMDKDYSYADAVKAVLKKNPSIDKNKLEKELEKYI